MHPILPLHAAPKRSRRWVRHFGQAALGPLMLLVVACGSSEPQREAVASQVHAEQPTSEFAELLTSADDVIEADYGDSMLAEGVATVSSEPEVTEVDAATPLLASFSLRRGESLAHFARWSELPVEDIAEFSELPLDGNYPVGTEVKLPLEGDALATFESLRAEHQQRRVEQYLASRGGAIEEEVYKVRTGDSAWGIARQSGGVPVWLIESYNPEVDLEHLRPGDQLVLPVLADVVVDADSEVTMP
ncbi:MAG: LysM domain-containing protein [Deltaproteobacteria bacterium]|nr:MAG: LysM domain-containing protein [Deltaproteobacteria bacterium]